MRRLAPSLSISIVYLPAWKRALANHPHGGEKMQDILSGQLFFVSWLEIAAFAPLYAVALAVWFAFPRIREGAWFFAVFAVVVTSSVQLAGIYVVFASLILPALAVNPLQTACGLKGPPRTGCADTDLQLPDRYPRGGQMINAMSG